MPVPGKAHTVSHNTSAMPGKARHTARCTSHKAHNVRQGKAHTVPNSARHNAMPGKARHTRMKGPADRPATGQHHSSQLKLSLPGKSDGGYGHSPAHQPKVLIFHHTDKSPGHAHEKLAGALSQGIRKRETGHQNVPE